MDNLKEEFEMALDTLTMCVNGLLEECIPTVTIYAMCAVLDKLIQQTPQHNIPPPVRDLQNFAHEVCHLGMKTVEYIDHMDPKDREAAVEDARRNSPRGGELANADK